MACRLPAPCRVYSAMDRRLVDGLGGGMREVGGRVIGVARGWESVGQVGGDKGILFCFWAGFR